MGVIVVVLLICHLLVDGIPVLFLMEITVGMRVLGVDVHLEAFEDQDRYQGAHK
jgi:hypothetical protein